MYFIIYFVVLSLSQHFTNQLLNIDSDNKYSYTFDKKESVLLILSFLVGVVLTFLNLNHWLILLLYGIILTIVCFLAMGRRKTRVEKLREEMTLIYDILKKMIGRKDGFDFNNPPFELGYKYGTINQIDVTVDPASFDDKHFPTFLEQFNNFLPTYTWQYELKLEKRIVSFVGKDKPPNVARWAGSWLQDFRYAPIGISGSGEVGIKIANLKEKDYSQSQFLDEKGVPIKIDTNIAYQPHYLGCGATNGGKSVGNQNIILHFLEHRNKVSLLLLDPKFVEFEIYKDTNGVVAVANTAKEIAECLRVVRVVMEKRNKEMSRLGIKNIHEYRPTIKSNTVFVTGVDMPEDEPIKIKLEDKEHIISAKKLEELVQDGNIYEICLNGKDWIPVNKKCVQYNYEDELPFLFIVVDELAEMTMKETGTSEVIKETNLYKEEIMGALNSIAQLGRSAGLHLLVSTQKPNATVVPTVLRSNLGGRMFFGKATEVGASLVTLDNTLATTVDNSHPGMGVFQIGSASDARFTRFYFSEFKDLEDYYKKRGLDSKGYSKYDKKNIITTMLTNEDIEIKRNQDSFIAEIDNEKVEINKTKEQDWSEV